MKNLKFRCSSLSEIANVKIGLTDKQDQELETLKAKEKLTAIQSNKLKELEEKKTKAPDLTAGGKTFVESLVKQKIYKYEDFFTSKYTDKGTRQEETAIDLLNLFRETNYQKNSIHFKNDFITGTPDIITSEKIIDIKCSWSKKTFPIFENEAYNVAYEWQMRGYMALTEIEEAEVIYCLVDTPDDLIGFEPLDLHKMEDIPLNLRFTSIKFKRNLELEKQIYKMVEVARAYASEYENKIIFK
jgi:uncharacterized protein YciU (UPF0263 family)